MSQKVISIDIGSTYTKGIICSVGETQLEVLKREVSPTTVESLPDAFNEVLARLLDLKPGERVEDAVGETVVYFSSSAKGGLNIAALGIVPELTLKVAKMTALSAGGKVCEVFPFKLAKRDLRRLEAHNPDILLFTGGTDGGNENYVLANAEKIGTSSFKGAIIYAGNRAIAEEVEEELEGHNLFVTENVLPDLDQPNPDPARAVIREVFLKQIVDGKGLNKVVELTGNNPLPTPLSMYEFIRLIPKVEPVWQDFCVIDMGGATTDFYSNHEDLISEENVVFRGVKEPVVKRTVEGDLGMRVTAHYANGTAAEYIESELEKMGLSKADFDNFVEMVCADTGYLPESETEKKFDQILARSCVRFAMVRHCGSLEQVYTAHGVSFLQRGKNIRKANKVIGTGGFLSALPNPMNCMEECELDEQKRIILKPENISYYADRQYLMPLLANLAGAYPQQAVRTALNHIEAI